SSQLSPSLVGVLSYASLPCLQPSVPLLLLSSHSYLVCLMMRCPSRSTLFPYTTLFRSVPETPTTKFSLSVSVCLLVQSIHACWRSEEHTSELQSRENLVCRLLLEKKKEVASCTTDAVQTRGSHGGTPSTGGTWSHARTS